MSQSIADPSGDFDDLGFVKTYESVSTLIIEANRGPIIIKDNTFEENIATMGGAIHIMSPDFESTAAYSNYNNSMPFIYIENNEFRKNMAYFAGNALYIAHSINRFVDFESYRNMCGAGEVIQGNLFEANTGLKRHNGGAYVHHCILNDSSDEGFALHGHTSSLALAQRNKTEEDEGDFEYYYEDPTLITSNITDLYDSTLNYTVLKYAT